eukprot:CAMPEP_0205804524 /NCGR_PEP_ID=MMETSP0205-20121125/7480_1 /ASSEMBLY_ACC=CAM_ASM_000278 /TAXON_ID=36767 /ORGANISM="Euplotes focardii, Strain TN1" /LENGTH=53 /DNA_ID=CAMNT_0053074293 /DNA_START=1232 /DNA_END=1393 /DNA_ORIENTATION=+
MNMRGARPNRTKESKKKLKRQGTQYGEESKDEIGKKDLEGTISYNDLSFTAKP